ncbi:uncharacterized protein LOC117647459 [Thrips palmi]|uniref:Uncharacterized protein LOC117647459 n=1 Tax=Thrips palmi TaxID=161013 RepID=A0A6P8ZQ21_THRPL|nr:uncharacterized protein LOC117647459 [Thrips palmi]
MSGGQNSGAASSRDSDPPPAILCEMSVPGLDSLYAFTASIDRSDLRDPSARSDFHWQTFKCRLAIFTLPVLVCPVRLPGGPLRDLTVICRRQDLDEDLQDGVQDGRGEAGGMSPLRAKLASLQLALSRLRPASSAEYAACLEYTLAARMAPLWNPVAESLVRGKDFLSSGKLTDAVRLRVNVHGEGGTAWISIYPSRMRIAPLAMGDMDVSVPVLARFQDSPLGEVPATCIGNPWVNVLPSLKRGMVTSITKTIPPECPFQRYKDFRRHWKNMYGYRLPDDDGGLPYVSVYFERLGKAMCYPWLCLTPQPPVSLRARDPPAVAAAFLADVASRMPTVCGVAAPIELDGGLVEPVAQLCAVRGLRLRGEPGLDGDPGATQPNLQPYQHQPRGSGPAPSPSRDGQDDAALTCPLSMATQRNGTRPYVEWNFSRAPAAPPAPTAQRRRPPPEDDDEDKENRPPEDYQPQPPPPLQRPVFRSRPPVAAAPRLPAPGGMTWFRPTSSSSPERPPSAGRAEGRAPSVTRSPARSTATSCSASASASASANAARKASAVKRPSSEPLPIPELRTADACRRASIPMLLAWLRSQGVPCRAKDKKGDLVDKAVAKVTQMAGQHAAR